MTNFNGVEVTPLPPLDTERLAISSQAQGFHIRHPPQPNLLASHITLEQDLFQTIHMGAVDVDTSRYLLVIDGLVSNPFALTIDQLKQFPVDTVSAFHECFGSPIAPATKNLWRVGNVTWTGVSIQRLISLAQPLPSAMFVWSEGLDSGVFAGTHADRYQKDLPLAKAMSPEVLVAWLMNGEALERERGGPVRLVVPGWFGTNSTKWLCRLTLASERAKGPYTTKFYNVEDPEIGGKMIPVWEVDVNSMIVRPRPNEVIYGEQVEIQGWAWSCDGVVRVEVSVDDGKTWKDTRVEPRGEFSWQNFKSELKVSPGEHVLMARATTKDGKTQALSGRRNHVHKVKIKIQK